MLVFSDLWKPQKQFKVKSVLFLISIAILSVSCLDEPTYEVHQAFEIYVQRFKEEANNRGFNVNFVKSGLTIQFTNTSIGRAAACLGGNQITIDESLWTTQDDFEKEALIFHELGHCELDRGHMNRKLANGEWASIMRGDPLGANETDVINFAGTRRAYYIDEFFDPNTPAPDWAFLVRELEITDVDRRIVLEIDEVSEFDSDFDPVSHTNFEIDFELNTDNMSGFGGAQFMGTSPRSNIRIFTNNNRDIAIDSGEEVWGFMLFKRESQFVREGFNRITIQRKSDFYYVFVNNEFFYWFDFVPPSSDQMSSANIGSDGEPEFRNIVVSTIP